MSKPRILIIDDTPENLFLLGAALAAEFELQIATSGAMGIALASASPPDLILLDVMMPEIDGFETCRCLKADPLLKHVPVVFVTALGEMDSEVRGLACGAADYIVKPVNVDIARQRIGNLLERERLRKEVEAHRDRLEARVAERTLALSAAKEAAEEASRAKTTFLATMGHELRTPMTGIMGMVELARRRTSDPKTGEYLDKALASANRLMAQINDILDVSALESGRVGLDSRRFLVAEVLRQVTDQARPLASARGILLCVDMALEVADLALVGDAQRLGQVLLKLTENAIKFTPVGSVRVGVSRGEESGDDVRLRFEVKDSGIGISAEDQQRIFAPFEQVDGSLSRNYNGGGLGLAIVRQLVRQMGGEIGLSSEPGVGSAFWCELRLSKG